MTPKAQTPKRALLGASASAAAPASHATGFCRTAPQPKRVCSVLQYPVTQGQQRETCCLQRARSIAPLPAGANRKRQGAADRTRPSPSPRVLPRGHVKNGRRDPIFPAPYYPENTQSSLFEGANPPTAVFLVMTHKIPHDSDTIFLIKPAAKMKLYIWCLKKERREKKTNPY